MKLRHDLAALLPQLADADIHKFCLFHEKYAPHLERIATGLYDRLDRADQARFLHWFLKRWAKIDLVNGVERGLYTSTIARVKGEERAKVECNGRTYLLRDFRSQGYDFQLLGYDWFLGVHDIQYNQYEHGAVTLAPDDVIIDAGAFIGDTAVFFHHKLGGRCQIHSFELLDENLALLVHNLERNGVREEQVVLNKLALTDETGGEIVIAKGQSQGSTSIFGTNAQGDRIETITLDDYVVRMGLTRVDYIKMDIEGAEVPALLGARETIQHFRPRLAICLYHKWDDAFTIPQAIHATGVAYDFAFKWVQLADGWEAVLLASPAPQSVQRTAGAHDRTSSAASPAVPSYDALPDALAVFCTAYLRKWGQADRLWREKQQQQQLVEQQSSLHSALVGAGSQS
jgi:FkbM family methyltransferase